MADEFPGGAVVFTVLNLTHWLDAAIEESVIAHMNELLIALSDDAELSREDRYTQQQRLRTAIAHHGRKHKEDMEARHEQLTKGGTIL
ncbi:YdcY family protein [Escherichia coli]